MAFLEARKGKRILECFVFNVSERRLYECVVFVVDIPLFSGGQIGEKNCLFLQHVFMMSFSGRVRILANLWRDDIKSLSICFLHGTC